MGMTFEKAIAKVDEYVDERYRGDAVAYIDAIITVAERLLEGAYADVDAGLAAAYIMGIESVDRAQLRGFIATYWQEHCQPLKPKWEPRNNVNAAVCCNCTNRGQIRSYGDDVMLIDLGAAGRFRIRGEPLLEGHRLIIEERTEGGE